MKIALLILIVAFTFTSCSSKNDINSDTSTNFSNLTEELSVNICEVIPTNSTVYITDFFKTIDSNIAVPHKEKTISLL